ncbi:MAG: hypothetical protein VXZ82_19870 [Planctomycetota bacterium]|nr:hypothetical protein [Planctomycetota bacterium]
MKTLFDRNTVRRMPAVAVLLASIISSVLLFAQDEKKQSTESDSAPANFLDINEKLDLELDKQIYSGGEPAEHRHFRWLAGQGIKTIVSVDGIAPNLKLAQAYGLRYVHIPLTYSGISRDSGLAMLRVLKEMPGPIYVHCHHGQHRAPAAVAYMLRAGESVSQHEALEILFRGGTSKEYRGLWADVRNAKKRTENEKLPEIKGTAAVPDFAKRMATLSRSFEKLKKVSDGQARQRSYNALLLSDDFRELERSSFAKQHGGDFRALLNFSTKLSAQLHQASRAASFDEKKFGDLMNELAQNCSRCHEQFRN